MKKRTKLYELTDGDKAIFAKAKATNNPNWITNFYLRSESSGTYWRAIDEEKEVKALQFKQSRDAARRWKDGYDALYDVWNHLGQPQYFGPSPEDTSQWRILLPHEFARLRETLYRVYEAQGKGPIFFHPHGIQFIDWQLEMFRSQHPIQVVPGGYGSSKTWGKSLSMVVRAVMLPGYRAFGLGPYSNQSNEVYRQLVRMVSGTRFERFVQNITSKPNPVLSFGHSGVGQTVIECYPILEAEDKMLTMSGDEALIDQAELMPNLDETIRIIGSRLRGQYQGREMVGQITLLANSEDNQILWDLYDQAVDEPDYIWAHTADTYANVYLTVRDLFRFEKQVGKDEASRRRYLLGERPLGSGEHFSQASLTLCRNQTLDADMLEALDREQAGYMQEIVPGAGIVRWQMPYSPTKQYVVAADPGWDNPPARNSAVIGVWDVTHFPETPAILTSFNWVFGNNSPLPWISRYTELVMEYHAFGMNGFDATGFQSGYERMTEIVNLNPMPVQLTQSKKLAYLNIAKKLVAEGLVQIPSIPHFFGQLARYKLPDERMRQDIVMMLLVTAALVEPLYWQAISSGLEDAGEMYDETDRYTRMDVRESWHIER